jgi:hypothetical protein
MAYPSVNHLAVPPQPWGLPADAALLNTSFSSSSPYGMHPQLNTSKGFRAATTGGTGALQYPLHPQAIHHRWSAGGVGEQRSYLAQGGGSGQGPSRVTSPLLSDHQLTPAATAGSEGALIGQQQSRQGRASHEAALVAAAINANAKDAAAAKQAFYQAVDPWHASYMARFKAFYNGNQRALAYYMIPAKLRGWKRVRWAFFSSELRTLPRRETYDIVSSTFARLFPQDFDRAIPVIKHKGVDTLLLQWEAAVAALERAELKRQRTGREPLRLAGMCGPLFGCCAESIGCGCCACAMHCADSPNSSCCLPQGATVRIIPELQVGLVWLVWSAMLTSVFHESEHQWFYLWCMCRPRGFMFKILHNSHHNPYASMQKLGPIRMH